jgi:hypothetical protein
MSKWPEPEVPAPDMEETLEESLFDSGTTSSCSDECWVEPDGVCPHGHPSWLLRWGII